MAAAQFVTLRADDLVAYCINFITDQPNVAILPGADTTQPALKVDFFAGAIHLTIVEYIPAQIILQASSSPSVIAPVVG